MFHQVSYVSIDQILTKAQSGGRRIAVEQSLSGTMILISLPHLNSAEYHKTVNEKMDGFTLLHRLVLEEEIPITILCVYALVRCGADPNRRGDGFLHSWDLQDQSPIHFAIRARKFKFYQALTGNTEYKSVELPNNCTERKLALEKTVAEEKEKLEAARITREKIRLDAERRKLEEQIALEKSKTDLVLTRCLEYILKNELFENEVNPENKAFFLKDALHRLEQSRKFFIFKDFVLKRPDFDTEFYATFKGQMGPSMKDLKMKLTVQEISYDSVELEMVFTNTVLLCEKSIAQQDAALQAHQTAVHAHQATIQAQQATVQAQRDMVNATNRGLKIQEDADERERNAARMKAGFKAAEIGFKVIRMI
jgi:hypothetical protein